MAVRFTARGDGTIDAHCDPVNGVFDEALKDAIGSRAPRGARHKGLSTYWIDLAQSMLKLAVDDGSTEPFASGNVTYLRVDGDRVLAAYEFDAPGEYEESMPVVEFVNLLEEWRRVVIEAGGVSGPDAHLLTHQPPPRAMGPAT